MSTFTKNTAVRFSLATVLLLCQPFSLSAADGKLEMMTTPNLVEGTIAIEEGRYEEGIALSLLELDTGSQSKQAAALANLCIGYVKTYDLDEAERYCELGVKTGKYDWIAYINRGTLRYVQGDYLSSLSDYARALELRPSNRVSSMNFRAAQIQVSKMSGRNPQLSAN